jgi:hypothetical protein
MDGLHVGSSTVSRTAVQASRNGVDASAPGPGVLPSPATRRLACHHPPLRLGC